MNEIIMWMLGIYGLVLVSFVFYVMICHILKDLNKNKEEKS